MPIITSVAMSRPSMAARSAAKPPIERAQESARRQEDAVQAHHRAAVVGIRLRHVGQQPECRGRRAGEHEQAERRQAARRASAAMGSRPPLWLKASAPTTSTAPPTMP